MRVYIGTGGYRDTDLLGVLYPPKTRASDFLTHYARHFDTVEINASFHAPLGQKSYLGMLNKAPNLRYAIKLHQDFSHGFCADDTHARAFMSAISPMVTANKLAAILVQFAQNFHRTPDNRRYVARLCDWFADYPLAIEFRAIDWHNDKTLSDFARRNLMMVGVDYPPLDLPPTAFYATAPSAYIRLHGKNMGWHTAPCAAARHDYHYHDDELLSIARRIMALDVDDVYLYLQNTTNGYAVSNARTLKAHLATMGAIVMMGQKTLF